MFNIDLNIPAKALLFGEYGLLYGGEGVGCVLPSINFEVQINITDSHESRVIVESRFFEAGKEEFEFSTPAPDRYFYKALLPWKEHLKNKLLYIRVKKSFSPSLGFGSSASMITAISFALTQFVTGKPPSLTSPYLWKYIRQSLENIQGISSGYDVGIQLAYLTSTNGSVAWNTNNLFWIYQNTNTLVPSLKQLKLDENLISQLGCFIKTHIYSDTKKVLKKFSEFSAEEKQNFANQHTKIAQAFLENPTFEQIKSCMDASRNVSSQQQIDINHSLSKNLESHHIPFKTMGSGCGDCLWVAYDSRKLLSYKLIQPEDIAFSFSAFAS